MPRKTSSNRHKMDQLGRKERERRHLLTAVEDWICFVINKTVGLAALVAGGMEAMNPNWLPVVFNTPDAYAVAGIGAALLGGRRIVTILKEVVDVMDEREKSA